MSAVEWQDPPPSKRGNQRDWAAIGDALRSRPGEWALVASDASATVATAIKRGRCAGMAPGEFDAVARVSDGRRADIYALYVGDPR